MNASSTDTHSMRSTCGCTASFIVPTAALSLVPEDMFAPPLLPSLSFCALLLSYQASQKHTETKYCVLVRSSSSVSISMFRKTASLSSVCRTLQRCLLPAPLPNCPLLSADSTSCTAASLGLLFGGFTLCGMNNSFHFFSVFYICSVEDAMHYMFPAWLTNKRAKSWLKDVAEVIERRRCSAI